MRNGTVRNAPCSVERIKGKERLRGSLACNDVFKSPSRSNSNKLLIVFNSFIIPVASACKRLLPSYLINTVHFIFSQLVEYVFTVRHNTLLGFIDFPPATNQIITGQFNYLMYAYMRVSFMQIELHSCIPNRCVYISIHTLYSVQVYVGITNIRTTDRECELRPVSSVCDVPLERFEMKELNHGLFP